MATLSLPVVEKTSGVILYEGPSFINGKDIVVVATFKTDNEKTGNMVQVWILVADLQPLKANYSGADEAVCGGCKHRHFRSCYVNLAHGPLHIWKAWKAGKYPRVQLQHSTSELFSDRYVRLGAYGDPAAVPVEVLDTITRVCAGWTGYTHQWMKKRFKPYRRFCMASCDTIEEVRKAQRRRWKPFFVRQENEELPKGFFACPASAEEGKRLTCAQCRVCRGGTWNRKMGLPSIIAHGTSWKKAYFNRGMKLMKQKKAFIGKFDRKIP